RNMMRICLVVVLGSCLLVEKSALSCEINGQQAFCNWQSLRKVPVLPPSIILLDLSMNFLSEIKKTSFIGLEQLQGLYVKFQYTNKLTVREGTFRNLSNLKELHLGGNQLLILEPGAFEGLSALQNLDLIYNGLNRSILEDEYLKPLISLERIDLSYNTIDRIRPGLFFQNMTKLKVVDLKFNKAGSICEQDLLGFQGKSFQLLQLSDLGLGDMGMDDFTWETCGNPLRNISVIKLDLSRNAFNADKVRLFLNAIQGTKITQLILSSNSMGRSFDFSNLKDPNNETFSGLNNSSLKTLHLSENYIFSLKFSVFGALRDAEEIVLSNNKINQIQRNAFAGVHSLRRLSLSHNLLGEIHGYTFDNLPNLEELDLSHNHIGVVAYKSFSQLYKLSILNLVGNSLKQLHKFALIPNLLQVNISDNKLTSLYGLFDFAKSAAILDLTNNRLRDFSYVYEILHKMASIQILALGHNLLLQCIPQYSVPPKNKLIFLDLEHNALQMVWENGICLDVFNNLGNLLYLFLSNNSLRFLPDRIFQGLTSLEIMDLSYNSLTYLPQNIFPKSLKNLKLSHNFLSSLDPHSFQSLRFIDLGMNRFFCDCHLKDFLLWINQTNVTFFSPKETFTCEYPKYFLGVRLIDLNADKCEEEDERLISELRLLLLISFSTLIICFLIFTVTYIHFRGDCFIFYKRTIRRILEGHGNKRSLDTEWEYDAFLCFCSSDSKWVETALLKRLDSQFSDQNLLRCCFEARDFIPGKDYISSISETISSSRKTVCIVTQEFLKDGWCIETFKLAQSTMVNEIKDILILVVVGNIPHFRLMKHEAIRAFVKKEEYFQWPEDIQDIEWFYDRLTAKILEKKKVKDKNAIELQNIRTVEMS
ncbi:toll-like receptor 5, partial [Arapaima gigas]